MKIVRLNKTNAERVDAIVKDSRNELLTAGKVVNLAVEKGIPAIRRKFVKEAKAA